MFKKLLSGELDLKDAFWKFGVGAMALLNILLVVFGSMVVSATGGRPVFAYLGGWFGGNLSGAGIFLCLAYLSLLFALFSYSVVVVIAVFKAAAGYERSLWLRHLARLAILAIVFFSMRRFF